MVLVRLASRAVIGAFDRAGDVGKAIPELSKGGIRSVNVSLLAKAELLAAAPTTGSGKGALAAVGKGADWLGPARGVEKSGFGAHWSCKVWRSARR
jgi:hypothetical protein